MSRRLILVAVAATLLAVLRAPGARAQELVRPNLDWRTVQTRYFTVHYPAPMEEWTRSVVARLDAVHEAVRAFVGYAPTRRVTVVVEDPYSVANGMALPPIESPVITLWATPPDPRSAIGDSRSWGEILSVHEFAHIAHLARPTRNPGERRLVRLLPYEISPVLRRTPRWVWEGYATYVEGRLTGSGRPHGTWRPALLRQFALEGKLPSYGQLNSVSGFYGGAMAYLAGSAYLEWLTARADSERLADVWRRLTARRKRTFAESFAGIYGAGPQELYGRFTAELTGRALEIERRLSAQGLDTGVTVQDLSWYTGDPAVSFDGRKIAIVLRSQLEPARVVVWNTVEEPEPDSVRARRDSLRARMLRLDPQDVPAREFRPRPKKVLATLRPANGIGFDAPRFMPDGRHVLVSRAVPRADGSVRPDLFLWDSERGGVRRVTHGAAIRMADPSPDGKGAVGARCVNGLCSLVWVDLSSGELTTLARGAVDRVYYRPRYSPDGARLVYSVKVGPRWRLAISDADGRNERFIDPNDGASRFDAAFMPDGRSVVATSDRGGIHNLERITLATSATRALTRLTSAALAPAPVPGDSAVLYLKLDGSGLDLMRIRADSSRARTVLALDSALTPAAPVPLVPRDTFAAAPVGPAHAYGAGPRQYRVLPGGAWTTEGRIATLMVGSTDPIARLGWTLQGSSGDRGTWRGGGFAASWRGWRPVLTAELFAAEQRPSEQRAGAFAPPALDARYRGATLLADLRRSFVPDDHRYRVGASIGTLDGPALDNAGRRLALAEYAGRYRAIRGRSYAGLDVGAHGAWGSTGDSSWTRWIGRAAVVLGGPRGAIRGEGMYGEVGGDKPAFERFVIGGMRPPFFDPSILSQRIAQPALPLGMAGGRRVASYGGRLQSGELLEPYWVAYAAGDRLADWKRVIGADRTYDQPTIGVLRLTSIRLTMGAAWSIDEPFRHKLRGYLAVTYRP